MIVRILRGLPGCGKSSYIQERCWDTTSVVCSADDYFGKDYKTEFDPKKLPEAHMACFRLFDEHVRLHRDVTVDNTNLSMYELAPYYRLAELFTTDVRIITIHCDPVVAWRRNVHGVSLTKVLEMHRRMEACEIPPWWKHEIILAHRDEN